MKNSLHWIVDFCKVCLHNGLFSYDNDTKLDMYCSRIWIREKCLATMIAQDGSAIKTETKDKLRNQELKAILWKRLMELCVDTKTIYFYTLELFVEKKLKTIGSLMISFSFNNEKFAWKFEGQNCFPDNT